MEVHFAPNVEKKLNEIAVQSRMVQIAYASAAAAPFSRKALIELLQIARQNNSAAGVSGMLLYHNGSFLQVLEGPEDAVDKVFAKVEKDPRHAKLLLLFRQELAEREFNN